jgi:hypothetical protein
MAKKKPPASADADEVLRACLAAAAGHVSNEPIPPGFNWPAAWSRRKATSDREAAQTRPMPDRPRWERQKMLLHVDDHAVEYSREAHQQFPLLDAFEQAGWPQDGIARPRAMSLSQTKNAVEALNDKAAGTRLRFRIRKDGEGVRILWFLQ